MALVVLLRGVNVGGHKTFRPAELSKRLQRLDAVNIGAAGTFVIRRPIATSRLRAEFARRLPFATEIMICQGREIARLVTRDFFSGEPVRRDLIRFVSVLARVPRSAPRAPFQIPSSGSWMVRVLAREGRFVVGLHRRRMPAIRHLGTLDRVFGAPATTRNWNTIAAVAKVLEEATP